MTKSVYVLLLAGFVWTAPPVYASDYCPTSDNHKAIKYPDNQCDKFNLGNSDHALHVLGGTLITTVGGAAMHKYGASNFDAIVVPWMVGFVAGAAKEVVFDEITSGTNLIDNALGLTIGSILTVSFTF